MKKVRWLMVFGFVTLGCNAIVGNDGQVVQKKQGGSEASPGKSISALVSAGEVAKSNHYKMVFSVGQASMAQEKMSSSEHSMENGLVCTDGR